MKGVGAMLVSHDNSALVPEAAKHDLNLVSFPIKSFVVLGGAFPISFGWNAGRYAFTAQYLTKPVCIIATICQ